MSADAVAMGAYPTHTSTFNNIESHINDFHRMLDTHGDQQIAGAVHNEFIGSLVGSLKEMIRNSDLPEFKKDQYLEFLDDSLASLEHPVSAEVEEAVKNSPMGESAAEVGGSSGFSHGDEDGAIAGSQQNTDKPEKSKGNGGGKGNWLLELAKRLAEIQEKFLTIALDSLGTMEANASAMSETNSSGSSSEGSSGESGGTENGDKGEFLVAQAKYQAAMQMFNMMANMTATSLKSLGEGLTAIARKQ